MTRASDFLGERSLIDLYVDIVEPGWMAPFIGAQANFVVDGHRCLDVGCGTGVLTRALAQRVGRSGRVVGLDPESSMLEVGASTSTDFGNIEWVYGHCEALPFSDDEFDLIASNQTWQYLTDRAQGFREMYRVLKPGGKLVGGVWSRPSEQTVFGAFEQALGEQVGSKYVPHHGMAFGGTEALREAAEDAGFIVESVEKQTEIVSNKSIEELALTFVTGAMRTLEDGTFAIGMFDLDDPVFGPKVDALIDQLQDSCGRYVRNGNLRFPASSDVLVARVPVG